MIKNCLVCEALSYPHGICDGTRCQTKASIMLAWDGFKYRRVKSSSQGEMLKSDSSDEMANAALQEALNVLVIATNTTLGLLNAKFTSLGQKTSANSTPVVLSSDYSATGHLDLFDRLKNRRMKDTEECRYDIPVNLVNSAIYVGIAPLGTALSASSWAILKTTFDANGNPSREQILSSVIWNNRSSLGW